MALEGISEVPFFIALLGLIFFVLGIALGGKKSKKLDLNIFFYAVYLAAASSFFFSKEIFALVAPYFLPFLLNQFIILGILGGSVFASFSELVKKTASGKSQSPFEILALILLAGGLLFAMLLQFALTNNLLVVALLTIHLLFNLFNNQKKEYGELFFEIFPDIAILISTAFLAVYLAQGDTKSPIFATFWVMLFFLAKIIMLLKKPVDFDRFRKSVQAS